MGDFDKKYVVREAENILKQFDRKDKEEKRELSNLKKECKKIKKVNIFLKIISSVLLVSLIISLI